MKTKKQKTMNILVISASPWDDTNSSGNTLSNFFGHWDNSTFNNLYCRYQLPDNEICSSYFRITEKDIIKNIFNPSNIGKFFTKKEIYKNETSKTNKVMSRERKSYDFFRKFNFRFFHFIRDWIWKTGLWRNDKLQSFLRESKVDIIFAFVSSFGYQHNIIKYCQENTNAKLVLFFTDDVYSYKSKSPMHCLYKYLSRKMIYKTVSSSALIFGASLKLCNEYKAYFKRNIEPLYKGILFDNNIKTKKYAKKPIKMVYAGNLFYGRWKTLQALVDAMDAINGKSNILITLEIYTTTTITSEIDMALNRDKVSRIMGPLPYNKVKEVLADADIVLHVESFDSKQAKITRLSFSTKIIDCMQSGSCMMAIGPGNIASIEYLKNIEGTIVVTDLTEIKEAIDDIVNNPEKVLSGAILLYKYALENHNINTVRNKLQKDFRKILGI